MRQFLTNTVHIFSRLGAGAAAKFYPEPHKMMQLRNTAKNILVPVGNLNSFIHINIR
jgi:hypothetical protein